MITSPVFAGKSYAVLGLARSGLAAAEALLASGASLAVWDEDESARETARTRLGAGVAIADPLASPLGDHEAIIVSPGIALNTHSIADKARQAGVPLIGDIELFARARPALHAHKVIGITGTNGKSTTTALVHHIVMNAGRPAAMGGNIGLPIMARDPLPPGATWVLELSSYQLDLTLSLDCDISILLNISPDHLDRYGSMEDYAASKARLFAMQSPEQVAIIAGEDEYSRAIAASVDGRILVSPSDVRDASRWPALQGPHNAQNVAASVAAARSLGVADPIIARALATFAGLPHRMETIAEIGGVTFVNDSKATNAASAAPALAAFPPAPDPRIHWILGGRAKSAELGECLEHLGHVAHAYAFGESGALFAKLLAPLVPVDRFDTLDQALDAAARTAASGHVVLLSPASASFDQYRDFEARGDAFRESVAARDAAMRVSA